MARGRLRNRIPDRLDGAIASGLVVLSILIPTTAAASAGEPPAQSAHPGQFRLATPKPFPAINADHAAGRLDALTAAIYRYLATFEPARLPRKYASDRHPAIRCATPILLGAKIAVVRQPRHAVHSDADGPLRGFWPCNVATLGFIDSTVHPIRVHWDHPGDQAAATVALEAADYAWDLEVDQLGFSPPLLDGGLCGENDWLDIYLMRGIGYAYTAGISGDPNTSWDDWSTHIVIDPLVYSGQLLRSTVVHEFNHALQAADDWWEILTTLESTATFIEDVAYDKDNYYYSTLRAFQRRSRYPFEYNDDYQTYFLYGGSMYLFFLRDRYFGGDPSFIGPAWRAMRSRARGTYNKQRFNEPDFADGFASVLAPLGVSYYDSVLEFDRWRWFVGQYDDGAHFEEGGLWPTGAEIKPTEIAAADLPFDQTITNAPRVAGVRYFRVDTSAAAAGQKLRVRIRESGGVTWHVEALAYDPAGTATGWTPLFEGKHGSRKIAAAGTQSVILMVYHVPWCVAPPIPLDGTDPIASIYCYDPDNFVDKDYPFRLTITLE